MVVDADGHAYVAGSFKEGTNYTPVLMKFSPDLELLDRKVLADASMGEPVDLLLDGDELVCLMYKNVRMPSQPIQVIKTDKNLAITKVSLLVRTNNYATTDSFRVRPLSMVSDGQAGYLILATTNSVSGYAGTTNSIIQIDGDLNYTGMSGTAVPSADRYDDFIRLKDGSYALTDGISIYCLNPDLSYKNQLICGSTTLLQLVQDDLGRLIAAGRSNGGNLVVLPDTLELSPESLASDTYISKWSSAASISIDRFANAEINLTMVTDLAVTQTQPELTPVDLVGTHDTFIIDP